MESPSSTNILQELREDTDSRIGKNHDDRSSTEMADKMIHHHMATINADDSMTTTSQSVFSPSVGEAAAASASYMIHQTPSLLDEDDDDEEGGEEEEEVTSIDVNRIGTCIEPNNYIHDTSRNDDENDNNTIDANTSVVTLNSTDNITVSNNAAKDLLQSVGIHHGTSTSNVIDATAATAEAAAESTSIIEHNQSPQNISSSNTNDEQKQPERETQEQEQHQLRELRDRLNQIRLERTKCQKQQEQCNTVLHQLKITKLIQEQDQQRLLYQYMSYSVPAATDISQQHYYWNVTMNDTFTILFEHGNTIASINGLRLGSIVTLTIPTTNPNTPATAAPVSGSGTQQQRQTTTPSRLNSSNVTMPNRSNNNNSMSPTSTSNTTTAAVVSSSSSSHSSTRVSPSVEASKSLSIQTSPTTRTTIYRIPWAEINAALGQVILLLSTMEQNLQYTTNLIPISGIGTGATKTPSSTTTSTAVTSLLKYELVCMGSTSKIGLRSKTSTTSSNTTNSNLYNLYYTEEHTIFNLLLNNKKRNFDIALQLLLSCVFELTQIIQHRDRTVYVPYTINIKHHTIADIPITYFSGYPTATNKNNTNNNNNNINHEHAESWTRAMKYLLSNIKHIMSYRGIGLWNVAATAVESERLNNY